MAPNAITKDSAKKHSKSSSRSENSDETLKDIKLKFKIYSFDKIFYVECLSKINNIKLTLIKIVFNYFQLLLAQFYNKLPLEKLWNKKVSNLKLVSLLF